MTDQDKKAVFGWAMYDWANSAFATTVMAAFFPIFFKQYWSAGTDPTVSTANLGLANSAASAFIAIAAPVLGAIADRGHSKKTFLFFFYFLFLLEIVLPIFQILFHCVIKTQSLFTRETLVPTCYTSIPFSHFIKLLVSPQITLFFSEPNSFEIINRILYP